MRDDSPAPAVRKRNAGFPGRTSLVASSFDLLPQLRLERHPAPVVDVDCFLDHPHAVRHRTGVQRRVGPDHRFERLDDHLAGLVGRHAFPAVCDRVSCVNHGVDGGTSQPVGLGAPRPRQIVGSIGEEREDLPHELHLGAEALRADAVLRYEVHPPSTPPRRSGPTTLSWTSRSDSQP